MLAAIPYHTFPSFSVGPITLHTFGLMVALGILLGTWLGARYCEQFGISRDEVISLATRFVIAGIIGARLAWVVTNWGAIHSPLDVIAVWEGGLQFSGGFVAAVLVGLPSIRRWPTLKRWRIADGSALGLTVGLAVGRIGCLSVGEHLGGPTTFWLGMRYEGGPTREGPVAVGEVIHNTALYESLHLIVLLLLLAWLLRRPGAFPPGTAIGVFALWYGVARFGTDFLRAYDPTYAGLTTAQWMCAALTIVGLLILGRGRGRARRLEADGSVPDAQGEEERRSEAMDVR